MSELTAFAQLAFTIIVGLYFLLHLRNDTTSEKAMNDESKLEAEKLNSLRRIKLTEPFTERSRPVCTADIIGQADGIRALKAALWGENPQHVIIYGPPGVGKTAAARAVCEEIKNSPGSPFGKNAAFVEADACVMRCDERGFADPLIGSVHDPIYQGAGAFGTCGIPQPKPGAVTRAHGGILFLDEIGELPNEQINKLLKVLEDRRVKLESSYYSPSNKKIPPYIRDIFDNGLPADFRLIGATTRKPEEIPEAIRSRCVEIYFNPLTSRDLSKISLNAAQRCAIAVESGVCELIAGYAQNGRDAVKIIQSAANLAKMENRSKIALTDVVWVISTGHYKKRKADTPPSEKVIICPQISE